MSKVRLTTLMVLGAALAACSDTDRAYTVTALDARPAFIVAPADLLFGLTVEKLRVNDVQRPLTSATHNVWTVTDNGDGQGTSDIASLMMFSTAANAQIHCSAGFTPPSFPNQEGNVQIAP